MTAQSQADPISSVPSSTSDGTSAPTTVVSEPLATPDALTPTPAAESSEPALPVQNQLQHESHPNLSQTVAQPNHQTSPNNDVSVATLSASGITNNVAASTPNMTMQNNKTSKVKAEVVSEVPEASNLELKAPNVINDAVSTTTLHEEKTDISNTHANPIIGQQTDQVMKETDPQRELESDQNSEQEIGGVSGQPANTSVVGDNVIDNHDDLPKGSTGNKQPEDDVIVPQFADHGSEPSSEPSTQPAVDDPMSVDSAVTPSVAEFKAPSDLSDKSDAPPTSNNLIQTTTASKKRAADPTEAAADNHESDDRAPPSPTKRLKLEDGSAVLGQTDAGSTPQSSSSENDSESRSAATSVTAAPQAMDWEQSVNTQDKPAISGPSTETEVSVPQDTDLPDAIDYQSTNPAYTDVTMSGVEISSDSTQDKLNSVQVEGDGPSTASQLTTENIELVLSPISNTPTSSARIELPEKTSDAVSTVSPAGTANEVPKSANSVNPASEGEVSSTSGVSACVASAPLALRSAPIGGASGGGKGLLKLRSSPVIPASDDHPVKSVVDTTNQILIPGKGVLAGGKSRAKREKTSRSVKWAEDNNIAEVHFIDTRLNLVKSWDPDCEVTLPFAPHTLQAIKSVIKGRGDETNVPSDVFNTVSEDHGVNFGLVETGITAPEFDQCAALPVSSFEEARKREHDMEQERTRQAREELRSRLNSMKQKVMWQSPRSIVLPAECRIEESAVTPFDLGENKYSMDGMMSTNFNDGHAGSSNDTESPMSPPSETWGWSSESEGSDAQAQMFPLTDGSNPTNTGVDGFRNERANVNGMWNPEINKNNELKNTSGMPGLYSGAMNENFQNDVAGRAGGFRQNMGNERHGGHRGFDNGSGGLRTGADYSAGKRTGRERTRLILSPNVRQLLSALQSSGILNNAKMNEVLSRSEGPGAEQEGTHMASGRQDSNNMSMGNASGNYNSMNENAGMNDQAGMDNVNGGVVGNMGRMMGGVSGPIPGPGAGGMMGAPPFGHAMGQGGMLECMPFGMPPVPPNAMGIPPPPPGLMQMGMGLGMPMVGMPMMPMVPGNPMGMNAPGGNGGAGGVVTGNGIGLAGLGNMGNNVGVSANSVNGTGNNGHGSGGIMPSPGAGGGVGNVGNILGRGGKSGRNGRHVETITRPKSKGPKQRKKCKYFGTKQGCRDGDACMFAHN